MSQKRHKKIRKEIKVVSVETEIKAEKISYRGILKKNWLFLLLVCLGVIGVYLNGLNGDFVSDDYAAIINNPQIKDLGYALKGFPTVNLSNWLAAVLFGLTPVVFHSWSLAHYLVTLVVVFLFLRTVFGENISKLSLVLFAFHPMHVEAVAWNSGKPYLLLTIFTTISFLMLRKYLEEERWRYAIMAVVSFAIAFFADNPRPFALFPLVLLYFVSKKEDQSWRKLIKFWPALVVSAILFLVIALPYINTRINVVNSGYNQTESIFYNPFFQYPTGMAKYLQLFLVPIDLTLYHTMFVFPTWLNWAIFLMYLGMVVYYFFRDRRYFFALSFIFIVILPSMAPIKVSWLVAERYAFWPILGFCIFLALIFEEIIKRAKILGIGLVVFVIGLFGWRIVLRNDDWSTNHKLWVNTCQVSPNSHNAWNNIGDDYDKLADKAETEQEKIFMYENSIKGFTQSTVVKPNYADAYHNRANIFFKVGRLDLARDSYSTALNFSPGLYQTYLSLTQIDLMEQNYELGLEHAQKALQLQPDNPQAAYVLGVVYAESGNLAQGKSILQSILNQYPNYTMARETLEKIIQMELGRS